MIGRQANYNRAVALIKEYESCSTRTLKLENAMYECLKSVVKEYQEQNQNILLTLEQFKELNGKPVWIESLPKWLTVNEDCNEKKGWHIVRLWNGNMDEDMMLLPRLWAEKTYYKYWIAYKYER